MYTLVNNRLELKNEKDGFDVYGQVFAVGDKIKKPYSRANLEAKMKETAIDYVKELGMEEEKLIVEIKIGAFHGYGMVYSTDKEQHERIINKLKSMASKEDLQEV